jgi:hypothetical protein
MEAAVTFALESPMADPAEVKKDVFEEEIA